MNPTQKPWTPAEERKLRSLYPSLRTAELVKVFGRTAKSLASRAKILRLRKRWDVPGLGAKRPWSFAEDFHLQRFYPHVPTNVIAARLGRPVHTIYRRAAWNLDLRKTEIYLASPAARRLGREFSLRSIACRFRKGIIPHNKGLRRPGWAPGRMRETQFKKGQQPSNTMALWSFRLVDGYLMLKTGAPTPKPTAGWEYVHRLIWEQSHGPIPQGYRIWWKDGDHLNNSLANLELLSGQDHMARTTLHNLPPELRELIHLTGAVNRQITMRSRREEQSKRSA